AVNVIRELGAAAAQSGFDVDEHAGVLRGGAIDIAVVDTSDCAAQTFLLGRVGQNVNLVKSNVDAEVDADLADAVAEILEREGAVLAGITHQDLAAAAQNDFVEPEIVEVAAVGEVDIAARGGGQPKHLGKQRNHGMPGAGVGKCVIAVLVGVSQPGAQADVEDGHQETQHR